MQDDFHFGCKLVKLNQLNLDPRWSLDEIRWTNWVVGHTITIHKSPPIQVGLTLRDCGTKIIIKDQWNMQSRPHLLKFYFFFFLEAFLLFLNEWKKCSKSNYLLFNWLVKLWTKDMKIKCNARDKIGLQNTWSTIVERAEKRGKRNDEIRKTYWW